MGAIRHAVAALALGLGLGAASAGPAPEVVSSIPLDDPARWDYVSVDPVNHRLYVAHRDRVDVIDTRDSRRLLQLSPTPGVHGAAPAPSLNRVFTSNGADGTVGVFDAGSGRLLRTVKAGQGPDAIVYEPVTHRVFAFNGRSSDVTAIDARTERVLAASIPAHGTPEFAVVDGRGRVFFNVEDTSEIAVLNAATLKIERRYKLGPCEGPSGLAIDPRGHLYSVCGNGVMVVSDPLHGHVLGSAPIGRGPDGVAWMDGKAFSANGRDGSLSVVAEVAKNQFETVDTITTAPGARTIAVDPSLQILFTPTADFAPQTAPDAAQTRRPEPIAGTFRILVLKNRYEGRP